MTCLSTERCAPWLLVLGCNKPASVAADAPVVAPIVTITATVDSTRFVTREHMLAAGEMQISGEPFAQAMGRDLGGYSRDHLPTDLYFDPSPLAAGPWIDLAGFSTGVESYEYSKQPMNGLAFELGAGTSLAYGALVNPTHQTGAAARTLLATTLQHYAAGSNALGRFVFPPNTFPAAPTRGAANPLGWPGIWPTGHVFRSFDPTVTPTSSLVLSCAITSDDDPGDSGALLCADYECDATSLHLTARASQIEPIVTPGADGFSAWKYGLWVLNYLQIMHDSTEAAVATVDASDLANVGSDGNQIVGDDGTGNDTAAGTYLGSSNIEGFQAQLMIAELDNRAADWLGVLTTTDGATLTGFPSTAAALAYDYAAPLRWFPGQIAVTETDDGSGFPAPAYTLGSADSDLLDLIGLAMGDAELYAVTDPANHDVGGAQTALVYFDGDPFPADNGIADGENTAHDRALAVIRVALVDLDRLHTDPASGILVDDVTMTGATPARGHTISTTSVAYTVIGLRTVLRSLSSQLELYSNNTPDQAIGTTPLDALPIHHPSSSTLTFTGRLAQIVRTHASLLFDHLTDATGRAWGAWDVAAAAPVDQSDTLDAHTAAVRGLFAAYLVTGDVKYRDRAIAVYDRIEAVFYDPAARIFSETAAPVDSMQFTPVRFALLQSTLRDMIELVTSRPGNEAREVDLEEKVGRLNKLVLNGWDDRDQSRFVDWPDECVNVQGGLPRGGLQMAERTLTGEIGSFSEHPFPGHPRDPTSDRESDCVPEIDDAQLPAGLADAVTFRIQRP